jgi:uncharacterized protein YbjT (DUF2867 family)
MASSGRVLVTGATGGVGSRVAAGLVAAGVAVRGLTRDATTAVMSDGVEVAQGDLSDPSSFAPALDDVDTVVLVWKQISTRDPEAALAAITPRVRRIVYVSSLSIRPELAVQAHPMSATHLRIEDAIRAAGVDRTVLRAGWFMANTRGWAEELRATGTYRSPFPEAGRSPVSRRDVGDAGVAVVLGDGHDGRTYVLSGPRQETDASMVAAIAEATGRPYRCHPIDPEAFRDELVTHGEDPVLVDAALVYWDHLTRVPEAVTDDVATLTGRPARTYADWARAHAADF